MFVHARLAREELVHVVCWAVGPSEHELAVAPARHYRGGVIRGGWWSGGRVRGGGNDWVVIVVVASRVVITSSYVVLNWQIVAGASLLRCGG